MSLSNEVRELLVEAVDAEFSNLLWFLQEKTSALNSAVSKYARWFDTTEDHARKLFQKARRGGLIWKAPRQWLLTAPGFTLGLNRKWISKPRHWGLDTVHEALVRAVIAAGPVDRDMLERFGDEDLNARRRTRYAADEIIDQLLAGGWLEQKGRQLDASPPAKSLLRARKDLGQRLAAYTSSGADPEAVADDLRRRLRSMGGHDVEFFVTVRNGKIRIEGIDEYSGEEGAWQIDAHGQTADRVIRAISQWVSRR